MLMSVNVFGERLKGMETRWYMPNEKSSTENDKTKERKLALHTTKNSWKNITAHLDKKRLECEAVQKEIDHRNYIKEKSKEMTKNWDNSVENIRKRKEDERMRRIEQSKEDKMHRFLTLRREQEEARVKYIQEKRKELYVMHGPPKALNSAIILSEVIYEREKQIEMKHFLEQHRLGEEEKYAQKVKQGAIDEINEKVLEKQKERDKKLETRKIYLEKIEENKKIANIERSERIKQELANIQAAERENEQMKKIQYQDEMQHKKEVKKEFDDFYIRQKQYKEQLEKEDEEQNRVINIYANAKCRIEEKRKTKEIQTLAAKRLRAEKLAAKVAKIAASKSEQEERILKEAAEEKERIELGQIAARKEFDEKIKRDRIEDRKKVVEQAKKQKYTQGELNKWIMLNRYKAEEVIKQKEEEKKKKRRDVTMNFREDLLKQIEATKKERYVEDKEREIMMQKFKAEDEMFLEYAQEITDLANKRERLLYPIQKVIMEYKKENNLSPPNQRICAIRDRMKKEMINCTPGRMIHDPNTDPNLKEKRETFKEFLYN